MTKAALVPQKVHTLVVTDADCSDLHCIERAWDGEDLTEDSRITIQGLAACRKVSLLHNGVAKILASKTEVTRLLALGQGWKPHPARGAKAS